MGQWEVYEAIQSLGGSATFAQIREYMRRKYRRFCASSVHDALKKLMRNGIVSGAPLNRSNIRRVYSITGEFPERNVIVIVGGLLQEGSGMDVCSGQKAHRSGRPGKSVVRGARNTAGHMQGRPTLTGLE